MGILRLSPITRHNSIIANRYFVNDGVYDGYTPGSYPYMPTIKFNEATGTWQYSNDGITFYNFGSGTVSGSFDTSNKYSTIIQTLIPANTNFTLAAPYTVTTEGDKLDIFLNGQLLSSYVDGNPGDYSEINTITIQFHYDVPKGTLLTYIIK